VSRVSGTNAVSDGNETNGQAPVSAEENGQAPGAEQPHTPAIHVVKGNPTDTEVAALVTVLAGASGGPGVQGEQEFSRWGLPVDKLRYAIHSWQRLTLVQRTHMRGR
jgi:hypothetical protein